MAEPAWKRFDSDDGDDSRPLDPTPPEAGPEEDRQGKSDSGDGVLLRWVERPDGRLELLELPLTPELFLNQELEDKVPQGKPHAVAVQSILQRISGRLEAEEGTLVLWDMQHRLGRGLPTPSPDISVIRGRTSRDKSLDSYNVPREGVPPCLILEVVSPKYARIRRVDEVDKVKLYQRIGVREYFLVDIPRPGNGNRYRIRGYRLNAQGRYEDLEPDERGWLVSETTGLAFCVPPEGDRIDVFDAKTGERLLDANEEMQARRQAEEACRRAEEARAAAERELERLRTEIARLEEPGR